jgi:hypothetical protein
LSVFLFLIFLGFFTWAVKKEEKKKIEKGTFFEFSFG